MACGWRNWRPLSQESMSSCLRATSWYELMFMSPFYSFASQDYPILSVHDTNTLNGYDLDSGSHDHVSQVSSHFCTFVQT